jgi:hypothetical protein
MVKGLKLKAREGFSTKQLNFHMYTVHISIFSFNFIAPLGNIDFLSHAIQLSSSLHSSSKIFALHSFISELDSIAVCLYMFVYMCCLKGCDNALCLSFLPLLPLFSHTLRCIFFCFFLKSLSRFRNLKVISFFFRF